MNGWVTEWLNDWLTKLNAWIEWGQLKLCETNQCKQEFQSKFYKIIQISYKNDKENVDESESENESESEILQELN